LEHLRKCSCTLLNNLVNIFQRLSDDRPVLINESHKHFRTLLLRWVELFTWRH
jgi:hypothetical protein